MSPILRAASLAAVSLCVFAAALEAAPSFAAAASTDPMSAQSLREHNGPEQIPVPVQVESAAAQTDSLPPESPIVPESEPASLSALVAAAEDSAAPLSDDEECLAGAVYFESRNESFEGQHAVADVVINRAESGRFPASICGVVYQPSQFSFVRGGRMPEARKGSTDWQEAVAVARIAMEDRWHSAAPKALFFHAASVSPRWRLKRVATVGNHVFYR